MNKPLILVSNDDGIDSKGIQALALAMAPLGQVIMVAPSTDQSAVSHSMSLRRPLRVMDLEPLQSAHGEIQRFSVDGTPTDSVYIAVHHILKERKPNLLVSGINHGANLGIDVLYSGTVSAAMEGLFLGIPSVAFSLVANKNFNFDASARFATRLGEALLKKPMPPDCLLNVNIPKDLSQADYAITRLGRHDYAQSVEKRLDPRNNPYYWIGGQWEGYHDLPGTDCKAIAEGYISVTPIAVELTSEKNLDWLSKLQLSGYESKASYRDI